MIDLESHVYVISNVEGGHGLVAKVPSLSWSVSGPITLNSTSHFAMNSTFAGPASKPLLTH